METNRRSQGETRRLYKRELERAITAVKTKVFEEVAWYIAQMLFKEIVEAILLKDWPKVEEAISPRPALFSDSNSVQDRASDVRMLRPDIQTPSDADSGRASHERQDW